jgi:hypothetical protein
VNGHLDLSICAIVHDVHLEISSLARSLCFGADVCTAGELSRRAATTGREGCDCANSGDSWFHVDVIASTNGELKWIRFVVSPVVSPDGLKRADS